MSNVFIPHDLVCDVVSRLPVKSLLRFKCVSKSWYLMIDDPEFVKSHAKRSELNESNMKLIARGFSNGVQKLYTVDFNFHESFEAKNMKEINYPGIMDDGENKITSIGFSNGLVCLVYSKLKAKIVLWNPSTRKHIQLPICSRQNKTLTRDITSVHGFGYDEVTDDYKVVRLVAYQEYNSGDILYEYIIYSLKSNEWRSSNHFAYGDDFGWRFDGVLANGALHWRLVDSSILTFNLATEEFKLLPPPETSNEFFSLCVPVMGGCLHLISFNCRGVAEMWAMKNYGTRDSWMKLDMSTLPPIAISNDVVIYDLEKQSFLLLKFPFKVVNACFIFESLVQLGAGGRSDGIVGDSREQNKIREDKEES